MEMLLMGTVVASDVFQKKLDSIFIEMTGVTGIMDDMIYGKSKEYRDRNLILFLETTQKNGLKLNKDKLHFKKKEVLLSDHRWSSKGISSDRKKINSIQELKNSNT